MNMAFKFRFVNEITGIFVTLALLALGAGIFLAGRAQGLFEPKFQLHTVFTTDEGSFGLKRGAEVRIRETAAGSVVRIEPDEDGNIQATFELKESFRGFVRTSSRAVVRRTLIITGDAYVEILVGNRQDPMLEDGAMIECVKDTEIVEQATQLLDDLREQTIPALVKLQELLEELPGVVIQARHTLQATEDLLRNEAPAVTLQAQDTLRETQKLLSGLQRHWLLRKYMPDPDHDQLLSPAAIGIP